MDLYELAVAKALSGSGGGGEPVIEALSVTENGTYTAPSGVDGYSPVTVNVSGGGGSPYTKLFEKDYEVSTSSTTATVIDTVSLPNAWTSSKILYIRVRDKAGMRTSHFYGNDVFFLNNNSNTSITSFSGAILFNSSGTTLSVQAGMVTSTVYLSKIQSNGTLTFSAKYNSSYKTIDGTYHVEVYTLDWPDNVSPFNA